MKEFNGRSNFTAVKSSPDRYPFPWKRVFILVTVVLIWTGHTLPSHAQVPPNVNIEDIKPEDIPDPETLKSLGASPEQIQQAMEFKQQAQGGAAGSNPQAPAPEVNLQKVEQVVEQKAEEKAQAEVQEKVENIIEQVQEQAENQTKGEQQAGIYGQHFFRNTNLQVYESALDMRPPDNYILGPGDEISITVWGFSNYAKVFQINKEGYIFPVEAGRIYLKGLTFSKAKEVLKQRFDSFLDLANSEFDVTLTYSRVISVNIVGEVFRPGTYKIPAVNTAFNALIASGGPNDLGTVRRILVKRNGKTVKTLDVYEYLMNPDSQQDFFLEDNDYIFVPEQGRVVSIEGKVNRPHQYELLDNENLFDLIRYAGGLKPSAYTKIIQILRYDNNKTIMIDVPYESLRKEKKDYPLKDGDRITVYPVPEKLENFVEIEGPVRLPARYEFTPGMRLSDLIDKAEGFTEDAYLDRGYILRTDEDQNRMYIPVNFRNILNDKESPDNLLLNRADKVKVFSEEEFIDYYNVTIRGPVRNAGTFPYGENMRVSDLIYQAGGLLPEAYMQKAFVIRTNDDFDQEYIPFNLQAVTDDENAPDNLELKRLDEVWIFSIKDFKDAFTISVDGAVRNPGEFAFGKDMTLGDALYFAGGLKLEAANNKIKIARVVNLEEAIFSAEPTRVVVEEFTVNKDLSIDDAAKQFKLAPLDQIFVYSLPEFKLQQNVKLRGEVTYPGTYTMLSLDERLDDIIERAGGLTPFAEPKSAMLSRSYDNTGAVIIFLDKALKRPRSRHNITLKDGDELFIPRAKELVSIRGAVRYPYIEEMGKISAPINKGKRAKYYVKKYAMGFAENARKSHTYVERPNGLIKKTRNFGLFKVYPRVYDGSVIVVEEWKEKPPKPKREKPDREPVDLNKLFQTLTGGVTTALTIYLLTLSIKNN